MNSTPARLAATGLITVSALCASAPALAAGGPDVYLGYGYPNTTIIGFATPAPWAHTGFRADYGSGMSMSRTGTNESTNLQASLRAQMVGFYLDWFPRNDSGWRFVGGLTINDVGGDLFGQGTSHDQYSCTQTIDPATGNPTTTCATSQNSNVTVNGKKVAMAGETYHVRLSFPKVTPYLGIGYGHHRGAEKGLTLYADIGAVFGKFTVQTETSLVSSGKVTQADVDAQNQVFADSLNNPGYQIVFQTGITYRF